MTREQFEAFRKQSGLTPVLNPDGVTTTLRRIEPEVLDRDYQKLPGEFVWVKQ